MGDHASPVVDPAAPPAWVGPAEVLDVADVPLQDAAVTRYCPVRADLDHTPAVALRRLPPSAFEQSRAEAAIAFDAHVLAQVGAGPSRVQAIDPGHRAEVQAATVAAMTSDADVIVGGWLPDDPAGRRTGRPRLLVRTEVAHPAIPGGLPTAWVPVEVRRHGLTREHRSGSARCSTLDHLDPADAHRAPGVRFRTRTLSDDALLLAHQWRLMEAAHLVAPGQEPLGGIVDRTGVVWWVPLHEPLWQPAWADRPLSALERYDHSFAFRLQVIAHRRRREAEPDRPRRVVPVWINECTSCPWRDVCREELEAVDHVSLVPSSTFARFSQHRDRGVLTRTDLARLHWPTAHVLHGDQARSEPVDLAGLLGDAAAHEPGTPLEAVAVAPGPVDPGTGHPDHDHKLRAMDRKLAVSRLRDEGIETVADLARLDRATVAYSGADVGHLPTIIDQARAVLSGRAHRARGVARVAVRRADVEVDVDMENVEGGVYLWGTHTRLGDRAVAADLGVEPGYRPFVTWEPMGAEAAGGVFAAFWGWLTELRARCAAADLSFAAYCYTSAEYHQMRSIVEATPHLPGIPSLDDVNRFTRSAEWVDLYEVVRTSLVTGHSMGLKKVAPLAGFEWRDHEAGGEQSMVWHALATTDPDEGVRATHRTRLLTYNEDDVRATLALRDWLTGSDLPAIEDCPVP